MSARRLLYRPIPSKLLHELARQGALLAFEDPEGRLLPSGVQAHQGTFVVDRLSKQGMRTFGSSCLLVFSLGLALAASPAASCSCMGGGFGEDEPCESWGAAAIFVGKVTGLTLVPPEGATQEQVDAYEVRPDHRVFHFDVVESFAGVQGRTADVETGVGDGDCGVDFTIGETYFVYAGGVPGGPFHVSLCGYRLKSLSQAEHDIAFARQVQRGEWTSLYGRVATLTRANLDDVPEDKGIPGITVEIEGPHRQRFEAVTNQYGWFTVKGRLAGTYTMRAMLPQGSPPAAAQEVEVGPDSCAGAEILVSSLGNVRGRVVDLRGRPVESMEVALMPVDKPHDEHEIETVSTDGEGGYLFEKIPAGAYFVAANPDGPGTYGPPYAPTYYPHADKLAGAGRVTLKPAQDLELEDLRLPPPVREVSVTGTVRWPDGCPVEGVPVVLALSEWDGVSGTTDADGRYEVKGYEGMRYWLVADGEWTDAVSHSEPQEVVLGREELAIDLVLDHPAPIKTPGEWHRRERLVPLAAPEASHPAPSHSAPPG